MSFEEKALERFLAGPSLTVRNKTIDSMKADLRTSGFEVEIHGRPIRTICQMEVVQVHYVGATAFQTHRGQGALFAAEEAMTIRRPKV